jgi:hypothetical protein
LTNRFNARRGAASNEVEGKKEGSYMNKIGQKIGMAMLGGSLALLIPFTAAAQDRRDYRFERDGREFQARREPVRVVRRREVRERVFEQGYRNGYNNRVSNGYYDSFGNWCAR